MPHHPSGLPTPDELPEPRPIERLGGREVYRNPWISVREDRVRFPHGHEGIYGVVTTNPCVGMLPFVDDDHVVLVRQWRYVTGEPTWEMPTGGNRPGEEPEQAAQRELSEEIGRVAGRLEHLATIDSSKSESQITTRAPSELATGPLPVSASTEAPARIRGYAYASVDLKSGSERSVIVVPSPVAAMILAAAVSAAGKPPSG